MSEGPRDEVVIRTPDRRLRVFVSSTLGELAEERRAVSRAISALRLTPVMFELGARPYPPAELYRAYLAQSDVFIGLYWQRYGQIVPGRGISGLEEEFELSGELPRLLYVKAPAPDREPRLADLLARVKDEASASYRSFRTSAELGRLVRDDLAVLLSERFAAAGGHAATAAPSSAGARGPRPLPVSTTSLLGRERAIDAQAGGGLDHLLQIVQDQQPRAVAERLGQDLHGRARPRQVGPGHPADGGRDQPGVGDRVQRHEYRARAEAIMQPLAHRHCQPGLADPARAGQRDQPHPWPVSRSGRSACSASAR